MSNYILISSLVFFIFTPSTAQESASGGVEDTSYYLDPQIVVMKSILFPGLGQVSQERLWSATMFYGVSLTYYLKSAFEFQSYLNTSEGKFLDKFYKNITIAGTVHILNIVDAYYFAFEKKTKRWRGAMFSDKPLKSPWGATLRSAMFPGWGQWYNESYIKSVFYIGTVSYLIYEINKNDKKYLDTGLEKYYDDYSRFSWYMGLTYVLMLADAHVDAYLYKFDETVDLSISFAPHINQPQIGLSLSF